MRAVVTSVLCAIVVSNTAFSVCGETQKVAFQSPEVLRHAVTAGEAKDAAGIKRPQLAAEENKVLIISYPRWPGHTWHYRLPEYVVPTGDRGIFSTNPAKKRPGDSIVFSGTASSPRKADYRIVATPDRNSILLEAQLTNTGGETWDPVAHNVLCLQNSYAPDFIDHKGGQTYIMVDGEFLAVNKTNRNDPIRAHLLDPENLQWIDRWLRMQYYWYSEAVSSSLIVRTSRDDRRHIAVAWEDASNVAYNLNENLNCIHSEPRFGALKPGETRTIRGKIYFFEGTRDELYQQFESDFPGLGFAGRAPAPLRAAPPPDPDAPPQLETRIIGSIPSYKEAPVFYDFGWEFYTDRKNLDLVHEGKAKLGILGIHSIDNFDWQVPREPSFWVQMESFWFVLPSISSDHSRDKDFVRRWINGWLDVHEQHPTLNWGARDAMSVGFRAMAFVWYLRKLHQRGEPKDEIVARIEQNLLWHQEYLRDHYNPVSNHGFWESMGLFETTRVHPDSGLAHLALDRLLEMIRLSVTEKGLHVEHSAGYHYDVWNWLRHYGEYLDALDAIEWPDLHVLVDAEKRMRSAMYYLYDHGRNIPQIGDTDARTVDEKHLMERTNPNGQHVLYDERAGLAIYKDQLERYAVFCIQNKAHGTVMPYHYHDDVLALYYAHDGEVILGDGGRYSYGKDGFRDYYKSAAAHNTIIPTPLGFATALLRASLREFRRAEEVAWRQENDRDSFSASLDGGLITRVVEFPRNRPRLEVFDMVMADGKHTILWHLGPDVVEVSRLPVDDAPKGDARTHTWQLTTRSRRKFNLKVAIQSETPHEMDIIEGASDPYLGWYSPGQKVSVPAKVLKIVIDVKDWAGVGTTVSPEDR